MLGPCIKGGEMYTNITQLKSSPVSLFLCFSSSMQMLHLKIDRCYNVCLKLPYHGNMGAHHTHIYVTPALHSHVYDYTLVWVYMGKRNPSLFRDAGAYCIKVFLFTAMVHLA